MLNKCRICTILFDGDCFLSSDDIQSCPSAWQEESDNIHLDLLNRWIRFSHVNKGLRHSVEVDDGWQQPIFSPIDLCISGRFCGLHRNADELLQQGAEPILDFHRQSAVLCDVHNSDFMRIFHFVSRFQHDRCGQHYIFIMWILGHLRRSVSAKPFAR